MLHVPGLYITSTDDKGRGVFSATHIERDSVIELCPVIFIPNDQIKALDTTALYDYYFIWPDDERICLALGYGSLYNHDKNANAEVIFDLDQEMIIIKALRNIESGEEICFHYLGDDSKELPYWF